MVLLREKCSKQLRLNYRVPELLLGHLKCWWPGCAVCPSGKWFLVTKTPTCDRSSCKAVSAVPTHASTAQFSLTQVGASILCALSRGTTSGTTLVICGASMWSSPMYGCSRFCTPSKPFWGLLEGFGTTGCHFCSGTTLLISTRRDSMAPPRTP